MAMNFDVTLPKFVFPPLAALFDMDGTMLDTERIYHRAWRAAGRALGYELSDELLLATCGRTFPDCYRLVRQELGPGFPMQAFQALWPVHWHEDVTRNGIPQKAGLLDLLDWLDAQGIPKAVATSTTRDEALFTLRAGGIGDRFQTMVSGEEIPHGKPAPDIYLLAAARLGVEPQRCLAFEDSEPGVLAASAAGMFTILTPDTKAPSPEVAAHAALVAPSLREAHAFLIQRWQTARQEA
jgi:beta-phosphoglucomutase-like phosphatase (HAD superfamily)